MDALDSKTSIERDFRIKKMLENDFTLDDVDIIES